MSSSHQSGRRIKAPGTGRKNGRFLICPECEKQTMELVHGSYTLSDGTFFEDLERWHCNSCNTILFDIPATRQIVESAKDLSRQRAFNKRSARRQEKSGKVPAVKAALA